MLLTGCVILAVLASYEFDRRGDAAGTYREVESTPVSPFYSMVALPMGMADAASTIFLVFLIGGAFTVVDETGPLRRATKLADTGVEGPRSPRHPERLPLLRLGRGRGENMQEQIIPLIPVLIILTSRLGFTPVVAVAMSAGTAFVGSAFSPINPFGYSDERLAQGDPGPGRRALRGADEVHSFPLCRSRRPGCGVDRHRDSGVNLA